MAIQPAQLEQAWLGNVDFDPVPEFDPADAGKTSYLVEPNVGISEIDTDPDGGQVAVVTLTAKIVFSRAEGEPGPVPFEMELDVHGLFRWKANALPPRPELAHGWLEYNGMYLLWPYLRAYVNTITGLSHLPGLTIYTMNVPKPPVIPPPEAAESDIEAKAEAAPAADAVE